VEWSLDGPLPELCPEIPTSNQDGHQAKNRKKGGMKFYPTSNQDGHQAKNRKKGGMKF
jgi:hypothetical protein